MEALNRLIQVLGSPTEVYQRAKEAPKLMLPILVIALLMTGTMAYYSFNINAGAIIEKSIEMSGRADQISEDQMEKIVSAQSKIMKYSIPAGTLIMTPIVLFLMGLYFYVVGKIVGGEANYAQSTAIVVYAQGVTLIWIVVALAIMFMGDFSTTMQQDLVPSNLAYFLDPETVSKKLYAFAYSVDFFKIWQAILMILGFSVMTNSKPAKSAAVVLIPWALIIAISLLFVG